MEYDWRGRQEGRSVLSQQLPCVGVQQVGEGRHHLWSLVPLPPPQEGPVIKHVLCLRIQAPEVPLSCISRLSWHLDKTVIERQVVSDGVLPLWEFLLVVGEPVLYELTDPVESQSLAWSLDDGHGDEGDVGVGRLAILQVTGGVPITVVLSVDWFQLDTHVGGRYQGLLIPPGELLTIYITWTLLITPHSPGAQDTEGQTVWSQGVSLSGEARGA